MAARPTSPSLILPPETQTRVSKIARKTGLEFIRLFGSSVRSWKKARDVDVVLGAKKPLTLSQLSLLHSELQKIFDKEVDIVELKRQLSPTLILEIVRTSVPLWDKPKSGHLAYIEKIEPLVAVAGDEQIARTPELQKWERKIRLRKLHVAKSTPS